MQHLITKIKSDSNLSDLLRHSGVMYASGLFSTLLITVQQISTAYLIGPADYGRLATVLGSGLLVMLIVDVRTWELGAKLLARPILDEDYKEIWRVITWLTSADVVTGFISALIVFVFANLIAIHLLHAPELEWLVRLYTLSIPFRMLSNGIARTSLRMYNRFGLLSIKSVVYGAARIVFMSGAALLGLGLEGVIIGAILAEIIGALMLLVMQIWITRRELQGTALIDFHKPRQFREGVQMMGSLWLSATLAGLQTETFIPILALLTTPIQVGLFRSGLDIAETIDKLVIPFALVLWPKVIKTYERDNPAEFLRLIKQSTVIMAGLTLPFIVGIVGLGPILLTPMLGKGYEGVAAIAALIALGFTFYGTFLWTRPALIAVNRVQELNLIAIFVLTLSILSLLIAAPIYGAIGGAAIRGGAMVTNNILSALVFRYSFSRRKRAIP
jgi:O-antigen/teichoic acid export membrane protein